MNMRFWTYLIFCVWCWLHSEKVAKRRLRIRRRIWPHRPQFNPGPPFVISRSMISCSHLSARLSDAQMFGCFEINDWLVSPAILLVWCSVEFLRYILYVLKFTVNPLFCPQNSKSHPLSDPGHCLGFLSIPQWSLRKWQPYHVLAFYVMFHLFLNSCIVH